MADGHEAYARGVLDGLVVQRDLMLRGDRLRRVADRLHLLQAVVEAIEAVGRRGRARPRPCAEGPTPSRRTRMRKMQSLSRTSQVNSHGIAPWLRRLFARRRDRFVDEPGQVALQFGQRLVIDVGHLTRFVMADGDVVRADLRRHVQVRQRKLGRIERRS